MAEISVKIIRKYLYLTPILFAVCVGCIAEVGSKEHTDIVTYNLPKDASGLKVIDIAHYMYKWRGKYYLRHGCYYGHGAYESMVEITEDQYNK